MSINTEDVTPKKSFARRDHLIDLEGKAKRKWKNENVHKIDVDGKHS